MNIPVVDLNDFVKGNAVQKQAFVNELGKAYEDVGFVAVKNHGISEGLIRELYQQIPQFTPTLLKAYKAFEQSGKALLQAIALYLGLNENYFDAYVHNGNSILRLIHYPPITQEPKSAIRAEQHEDINLITLLVGASAGGLQILDMQNRWVGVATQP